MIYTKRNDFYVQHECISYKDYEDDKEVPRSLTSIIGRE